MEITPEELARMLKIAGIGHQPEPVSTPSQEPELSSEENPEMIFHVVDTDDEVNDTGVVHKDADDEESDEEYCDMFEPSDEDGDRDEKDGKQKVLSEEGPEEFCSACAGCPCVCSEFGLTEEIKTTKIDASDYFPTGEHGAAPDELGPGADKFGNNPLSTSMRMTVKESIDYLEKKLNDNYNKFLKKIDK